MNTLFGRNTDPLEIVNEYKEKFGINYALTLRTCGLLSTVIYKKDPLAELNSPEYSQYNCSVDELAVSYTDEDGKDAFGLQVKYLVSVGKDKESKQMIVAFRGTTSNMNDYLTDIKLYGKLNDCQGRFHSGMYCRSEKIPIDYFVNKIVNEEYQVVFTGHSLGAAVAALVAIRVLLHMSIFNTERAKTKVLFIGFGSPAFSDNYFKEFIEDIYKENFHFYINEKDVVVDSLIYLANIVYETVEFQTNGLIRNLLIKFVDYITGGGDIRSEEIKSLLATVSNAVTRALVPNYTYFGETFYLEKKIDKRNVPIRDLKGYLKKPDKLINAMQNHSMKNYFSKIILILANDKSVGKSEKVAKRVVRFTDVNIPRSIGDSETIEENSYTIQLVTNQSETDVFLDIFCKNAEFIVSATLDMEQKILKSQPCSAKPFDSEQKRQTASLQFSISNTAITLAGKEKMTLVCTLVTHFEEKFAFKIRVQSEHFKREGLTHKQTLIEKMPVDLLYMYALQYIRVFKNLHDNHYDNQCVALRDILREISRIWNVPESGAAAVVHGFSEDELNGLLFSYFMAEFCSNEINELKFHDRLLSLDENCQSIEKMDDFVHMVLPTCYYLKNAQSPKGVLDYIRSFFLNIYHALTGANRCQYYFELVSSDDGYLDTIRNTFGSKVDFSTTSRYAGCYEKAVVAASNSLTESKMLQTIHYNRQIRDILQYGFVVGVIGKTKCGKSTFVKQMLPVAGVNASAIKATIETGIYLSRNHDVFLDYPHFDSLDFSHKLQFIFSKNLLNFAFMLCDAMEKMDSTDTMKLFNYLKAGNETNFVILLNRCDAIVVETKIKYKDYGKGELLELLKEVRKRCKLDLSVQDREKFWLTCLKETINADEQDALRIVGVLLENELEKKVFDKVAEIKRVQCPTANAAVAAASAVTTPTNVEPCFKKIIVKNKKGSKQLNLIVTNKTKIEAEQIENAKEFKIACDENELKNHIESFFKLQEKGQPRFQLKCDNGEIKEFCTIDDLLNAERNNFIVYY